MTIPTTVTIKKMVNGGYGLGQISSGQIILIRHALPEETITVSIEKTKKNYLLGRIIEVINPNPGRVKPPCPYYGQCGGCNLQHCQYSTQLEIKNNILSDLLLRQNGLNFQDSIWQLPSTLESPSQFGYRQRIRLQIGDQTDLGFFKFRSHEIVPVKRCLLGTTQINNTLSILVDHLETRRLTGLAQQIEIQQDPSTGKTASIFHLKRKPRPTDIRSAEKLCSDIEELDRVFFKGDDFPLNGPLTHNLENRGISLKCNYKNFSDSFPSLEYSWEIGGFSQVNFEQNINLIKLVLKLSDIQDGDTILDLFCGMGNFSIPLALKAKELLGVEGQGAAIRSAKHNAENAGLTNTKFIKADVHKTCITLAQEKKKFDVSVIDPPRQGIPTLAPFLRQITKKKLIYISCDPATLCRDLAELSKVGFLIRTIQPIDMFPQTHHLETVVLLEK